MSQHKCRLVLQCPQNAMYLMCFMLIAYRCNVVNNGLSSTINKLKVSNPCHFSYVCSQITNVTYINR